MPRVLNKHSDSIPPDAVYVSRPSKWGNPYRIGERGPNISLINREQAVALYRIYFVRNPKLVAAAKRELRGKDLVCWCAPLPCHADVLLEAANSGGKP